jgi:hypothetical protein
MISKPYDSNLSLVKALDLQDKEVCGYYLVYEDKHLVKDASRHCDVVRVNPYTICRNSGIKDKNGVFVYEYDLLKLTHGLKETTFGYLEWSEDYRAWKIRQFTEFGGCIDTDKYTVEVVGNIALYDDDAQVIYRQDEAERNRQVVIDNSYCPSKFKR